MTVRPLTTAVKCFDMIELLAGLTKPSRLAEIARAAGESRATTYQRLITLTECGWADRLADDTYRLSLRACRIANAALEQAGMGDRALPILQDLTASTDAASSLVVLERGRLIIAQRVEARGVLRADLRVGAELSFADSGSGLVWLAFGPDSSQPIDASKVAKRKIETVRSQGYALGGGGKTLPGIAVIAAPVFDRSGNFIASLSLVGFENHFEAPKLKAPLLAAAEALGTVLEAGLDR